MAKKKTTANLETGKLEVLSGDSSRSSPLSDSVMEAVETGDKNGRATPVKRTINIPAMFGFRRHSHKHKKAASPSSSSNNKSEATPLLEINNHKKNSSTLFSHDEEKQSDDMKQSVLSAFSSSTTTPAAASLPSPTGRKAWTELKGHLKDGDFLLQDASSPSPATFTDSHPNEKDSVRASMVQEAMGEIRSGMAFSMTHCLIAICMYLLGAIICYHTIFQPEWTIIDACYFAVTTFTTVGYGDLFPTTEPSMIFTCFYALSGVASLGIALGILGSNLIDAQKKALASAAELSKHQALSVFDGGASLGARGEQKFRQQQQKIEEALSQNSAGAQCFKFFFEVIPLVCVMLGLAGWIGKESGWDTPKTIYYLVITASTIGYGDVTPPTQTGRFIAIFFIPIACGAMGQWLGIVANFIIGGRQAKFRENLGNRELTQRDLDIMDEDGDGLVSRAEFLEFMLVAMNKIDTELVNDLRSHFNKLDTDGTGELSRQDLLEAARRKLQSPTHKLKLAEYKQQLLQKGAAKGPPDRESDGLWGRMMSSRESFFAPSTRESFFAPNRRESFFAPRG